MNNAPSFTFRLHQSLRFDRQIVKDEDIVSPGGYELRMKDADGQEKDVMFDFDDYEGYIDEDDPYIVHCIQKNPDRDSFPEINTITEHMLRNVTAVVEWYVYTGEGDDVPNPIAAENVEFEIIPLDDSQPIVRVPVCEGRYIDLTGNDPVFAENPSREE